MTTRTLGHFIGGEWTGADGALESRNPSDTNDVVARFPNGGAADVDRAVTAATEAFPAWSKASPEVRADVLDKVAATIFARANEIGELLAREEGKTRAEGIGETLRAARIFRYFAGEALRRHGQTLESTRPGLDVATYREALGVVGLITPWNFPIAIPAWKAAPALAFGNTVVLKPANITPAIAAALTEIIAEAGAPAGVFNLVLGRGDVGRAITDHRGIVAVSFTGSQTVGAQVGAAAMARQARVQMEMGGKNPLVILADATDEGGRLAAGGDKVQAPTSGYFMQPTVIADTAPDMRINCEEVFGPVVSTIRAKNYEEALEIANRGEFGLSAGIVSNSAKHIRDFRKNVRAGMVMVNLPTAGVDYHVPFVGTRGSSYGPREQGFAAVEFYTQVKTVYTGD